MELLRQSTLKNALLNSLRAGLGILALPAFGQVVLTGELLTNPDAETGNLTGWTVVSGTGNTTPSADNGTYDTGYNPHAGSYDFVGDHFPGGGGAQGYLRQNVDVSSLPGATTAQIDAGTVAAQVTFWELSYNQGSSSDYANIGLSFKNASAVTLQTVATSTVMSIDVWKQTQVTFTLPAGTRSIDYLMQFYRASNGGTYIDSFIDDNSLKLISVPEPATLTIATTVGLLVFALGRRKCEPA